MMSLYFLIYHLVKQVLREDVYVFSQTASSHAGIEG